MKRTFILLLLVNVSLINYGQIIADHTVVDKFNDIPQYYIDQVKKMWLVVAGESHSLGYMNGLVSLESSNSAYDINYTYSGAPEAYTTAHLRISRSTWGDLNNGTGWIFDYGEEDWFTSALAISRTKAGITYCHNNSLEISAFGFAWCYDGAYTNMIDYLAATQSYIDYCTTNGYSTKVYFSTGPVDDWNAKADETSYLKSLAYNSIRDYVEADATRILFDYADILCYNDDGTTNSQTWNGHTFPIITTTNNLPAGTGHISSVGEVRLAKVMWWMLARIAGWDGGTSNIPVTGITVTGTPTITIDNSTTQLTATVLPTNATTKTVTWSIISGTGSAMISLGGLVTAITNGTVMARATANDGTGIYGELVITITNQSIPVTGITLTGTPTITTDNGTTQLTATVSPTNATTKTVTWSITNGTGTATISTGGLITALTNGTVTARATANDGTGVFGALLITITNQVNPSIYSIAGTGGSINPAGTVLVNEGSNITFTITANSGYQISDVIVDNISRGAISSYTFTNVISSHTIEANFLSITTSNIALNKPASSQSGRDASRANDVDGTNASYWSADPYPRWWQVDLGNTYDITLIVIRNYVSNGRYYNYNIEASLDGQTYTRIAEKINTNLATDNGDTYSVSTTARYLRVNMLYNNSNMGVHISDFQVYGTIANQIIPVTGITVTGAGGVTAITTDNETLQLSAAIIPANATTKTVTWTIINGSGTAMISPSGLITALTNGTVTARATANDGTGIYGELVITITNQSIPVTGITLTGTPTITTDNGTTQLTATVSPTNATTKTVTWSITNGTGTATISTGGLITALTNGTVTARATANDGTGVFGALLITITNQVNPSIYSIAGTGGSINPAGTVLVNEGSNITFTITANSGYQISDVIVDNISRGAVSSYTFTNVISSHTIEANFLSITTSNIALNKPASSQSGRDASRANDVDGTNASYWNTDPYPRWWQVDLGNTYDITSIVIRNYVSNGRYYNYNIEASLDGQTYTRIAEKTNTNLATDNGDTYSVSTTARYLRVNMIYNSSNLGVHISDFRAYGVLSTGKGNSTYSSLSPKQGKFENDSIVDHPEGEIKVNVYPNPFKEELNLRIDSPNEEQFDLCISNLSGRVLYYSTKIPVNTLNQYNLKLEHGMYLLRLSNKRKVVILKIIRI